MMACDFYDEHENHYPLTFQADFYHTFDLQEPGVPDLVAAMHMAGIVIEGVGAKVVEVGRRCNEVNPKVLSRPMQPGETSGCMASAGETVAEDTLTPLIPRDEA